MPLERQRGRGRSGYSFFSSVGHRGGGAGGGGVRAVNTATVWRAAVCCLGYTSLHSPFDVGPLRRCKSVQAFRADRQRSTHQTARRTYLGGGVYWHMPFTRRQRLRWCGHATVCGGLANQGASSATGSTGGAGVHLVVRWVGWEQRQAAWGLVGTATVPLAGGAVVHRSRCVAVSVLGRGHRTSAGGLGAGWHSRRHGRSWAGRWRRSVVAEVSNNNT
jgi:hypothetical protein